jgi:K+-transporting ATPase ATPase C chain
MNNSVSNTARLLWAGLRALLVLTLVTGVVYPLAVTGVAQTLFPDKANGSEISYDGKVVGSSLIGQQGYSLAYFQPRPADGLGENSVNTQYRLILSGATNLSADISPAYADLQIHRVAAKNGLTVAQVRKLVDEHTEGRTFGFVGEPRVNVLELNTALRTLVAGGPTTP